MNLRTILLLYSFEYHLVNYNLLKKGLYEVLNYET